MEQNAGRLVKPYVPCSKGLEQETADWNKLDAGALAERATIIEANGVPQEWAEGFALLCTVPRPAAYAALSAFWINKTEKLGRSSG